jgi:nicotinamidase-related amidase
MASVSKKHKGDLPMSLELDPGRTALVAIDIMKRVFSWKSHPHPVQEVVTRTARLANVFRRVGSFVVFVRVDFSSDDKDALNPLTDPPSPLLLPHATSPEPEDWSAILPELGSHPLDHLITKHQWGAFFGTDLDLQLRRRKIDTIVLCGIATNIGVETTAREAYQHGYNQIFATDAMNAYSEEEHQHTCTYILPRMGCVRSTDEIVSALSSKR